MNFQLDENLNQNDIQLGEKQITIDGLTHALPRPFLVMATQNPVELEGTFPLPEAQIDRFLLRVEIGYPSQIEENDILQRYRANSDMPEIQPVTEPAEIIQMQKERSEVRIEDSVRDYIVQIARSTRDHPEVQLGASPRAAIALYHSSQAWAAIHGRDFVLPDDIKKMAPHVLTHRLMVSPQAQLRGRLPSQLVDDIVGSIPVPVEN